MPCYSPLTAYHPLDNHGQMLFSFTHPNAGHPITLPCGQCINCRIEKSRQWALRIMHEADLYYDNAFITLTYDQQHLPGPSLDKKAFPMFMKRLRKAHPEKKIRYYMCGEYGDKTERPHFHAIIFNHSFPDKKLYKNTSNGPLYISPELSKKWKFGYNVVAAVTFETAAYCASYVIKKVNGKPQQKHYERLDPTTGEIINLQPEFSTMSRRPGIAHDWYDKYKDDCYPSDYITSRGRKMRPPKFYDNILKKEDPFLLDKIKDERQKLIQPSSPELRLIQEKVAQAKLKLKQRCL